MPNVISSKGLVEFLETGKPTAVYAKGASTPEKAADSPATEGKPPETKAAPAEKVAEAASPAADPEEASEDEHGTRPTDPEKVKKRFQRMAAQRREAQEEAAEANRIAEQQFNERKLVESRNTALEAELATLKKPAESAPSESTQPKIEDYKDVSGNIDWVKFQRDTAKHAADEAVGKMRAEQESERSAAAEAAIIARASANATSAREKYPDFDKVMKSINGTEADQVPQYILNYLKESANPAFLAYHLAKNDEDRSRIAKLSPILGIAEMGKLEEKLLKPQASAPAAEPPAQRGGPPAPIIPLSGEGVTGIETDPAKMTYKQLRAYERERQRKKD